MDGKRSELLEAEGARGGSHFIPAASSATDDAEALRAAVERLQNELVACQRMAMLGTMSGMVAHEFNNLMLPVTLGARDALDRDDVAAMRKVLERAWTNARKAIEIAQQQLGLAHAETSATEACRLDEAVQEAVGSIARPWKKAGIDLSVSVAKDLVVWARRTELEQLILNLLLNACDAMKDHRGRLAITAERDGDYVVFAVCDSGKGMPAEQLDQVINPFLAAAANRDPLEWQSVGMGLNVCRLIAQRHGAEMQARPSEGRGCTFTLRWPAAKMSAR